MSVVLAILLQITPPPAIVAWLDETFKDPASVQIREVLPPRDAEWTIYRPLQKPKKIDATIYCYKLNGKNSYGGYEGFKGHVIVIERGAGKVVDHYSDTYLYGKEKYQLGCEAPTSD